MVGRYEAVKAKYTYDPHTGEFAYRSSGRRYAGCKDSAGYIQLHVYEGGKQKRVSAGRFCWFYVTGELPKNTIDHIDGDRTNNKFSNLRDVTQRVNNFNKKGRGKVSSKGVTLRANGAFRARYKTLDGVTHSLGNHKTEALAVSAIRKFIEEESNG